MFSNLLYFLMALVIYTPSELFKNTDSFKLTALPAALGILAGFGLVCHLIFRRLDGKSALYSREYIDDRVNRIISGLSVAALILFGIDIYFLKLPLALSGITVFDLFPTFKALIFIGLYLIYLLIIWNEAFRLQNRSFSGTISRKEYILSNISFSLPALLPWLCLSLSADLLGLIPWLPVRQALASPLGEVGFIALFLAAVAVFGPVFIRTLWRCRPLPAGYRREQIETVCRKAGLVYADILKWDLFGGNMITAGVMGFVGRFRYLLVTPALLGALDDEELEAVILHEIGHVQRYHMVFYLLFFAGFMACNFVFFEPVMLLLYLFSPAYQVLSWIGMDKATALPVLVSLVMIAGFVLYFRFIFGYFMRNFERQADLHVYEFSGSAQALITTFRKIAFHTRQDADRPNWHHYSIGERVRFLEQCEFDPSLIRSHHARVKKMIAVYVAVMGGLFAVGYAVSYGPAQTVFDHFVAERILLQELDLDPSDSDMYALVGDYYYSRNHYDRAIDAYENVLRIDPDHVHVLNNLSWLFSTCPEERYRDGGKALSYAERALALEDAAHVWDTYAEALFVNHDIQAAVRAARTALGRAKENRVYYERQLQRFESLLIRPGGQIPMGRKAMPAKNATSLMTRPVLSEMIRAMVSCRQMSLPKSLS